ncbi:hypothetical protein HYDPIDRAFT_79971 [Hydnomerulius pinastri MD-312]|nr:hypothetical protein HYDPIDRAFT_79971 [Hydnomerulius pinastri MD-312]
MKLIFSDDFVRHTTITDENGQVLYKVTTPFESIWAQRMSTIWKATRPAYDRFAGSSGGRHNRDAGPEMLENDGFKRLAEIEWHKIAPSRLRWFGGAAGSGLSVGEVDASDFIPPRGILRRERVFTAPDGGTYRWDLGMLVCTLYREDGRSSKIPIARYHRRKIFTLPFINTSDKGYLEISMPRFRAPREDKSFFSDSFSEFGSSTSNSSNFEVQIEAQDAEVDAGMLDLLIFTYVYVEKLRKDREQAIDKRDLLAMAGVVKS